MLEVCASDIGSVEAAAKGGAMRVELCSALSEGGLTPSIGLIEEALKVSGIKVNVLIRPRAGDFVYSEAEIRVMLRDIDICRRLGVNGVVFGALAPDGSVDVEACRRMIDASGGLCRTFHRAFDMCRDPHRAAQEIMDLGFDRILTSGQADSALAGSSLIGMLQKEFPSLTFIAAGGIGPRNAAEVIDVAGVKELHASAKTMVSSSMLFRRDGVSMGLPDADEYSRATTSESIVRKIMLAIKNE